MSEPVAGNPISQRSTLRNTGKPTSPHVNFYKNFGRPIAKVFFGAVFVYQGVYWLWLKMETEEIKARKQNQISELEAAIRATKR